MSHSESLQRIAEEKGVTLPPEGVSWSRHIYDQPEHERAKYAAFLQEVFQPVPPSPEEQVIREEIQQQLASLPENPTEDDYKKAGIEWIPIEESEMFKSWSPEQQQAYLAIKD